MPLAALARETGISTRTLQRWLRLYRTGGASALDQPSRASASKPKPSRPTRNRSSPTSGRPSSTPKRKARTARPSRSWKPSFRPKKNA
ncbi:helix-turn-helix domain-containing protein [Pseudarthrobacter defluvii]|uniref:helix-turn-helix domain-containing protein n=1 Tax=Pseudarthrobacter defluvii TaxID=410837 RepID=UPI002576C2A3|nr:helix-turn-helix domain-containing protein [Pseudarthrobacter defluvii]